jgi:nucleotide-binding universal stress UspA family protein
MQVEHVILKGAIAGAILKHADERGADLIVAGTRGAGFIRRMLVGSVATRIIRHAKIATLIVPDPREDEAPEQR